LREPQGICYLACGGTWGGLLTALSLSYGAMGAVIHGPLRDTDQINSYFRDEPFDPRSRRSLETALGKKASEANVRKIRKALHTREKFPIFGTGMAPTDSASRIEAFHVGEPIRFSGELATFALTGFRTRYRHASIRWVSFCTNMALKRP
jgi:hypothetical protein